MAFGIPAAAYTAIAAVGSLAYGVYSGQEGSRRQERGLKMQQTAQQTAEDAALRQRKEAAQAAAKAARQQPDIADIFASEQQLSRLGSSSTTLTGPQAPKRGPAQLLGD